MSISDANTEASANRSESVDTLIRFARLAAYLSLATGGGMVGYGLIFAAFGAAPISVPITGFCVMILSLSALSVLPGWKNG